VDVKAGRVGQGACTIDGTQIKKGRTLLGWTARQLANAARVRVEAIERAERSTGELPLTTASAIQQALERAGVEFKPTLQLKGRVTKAQ
jgi:transcriptional regulator with XRE-family HTH domain